MKTATTTQPATNRPTYSSYGRTWQLWKTGTTGERTIEYWDQDGVHQTVAYIRTRRKCERQSNGEYKTTITWETYQWRWTQCLGHGYASDVAAFRAFTKSL